MNKTDARTEAKKKAQYSTNGKGSAEGSVLQTKVYHDEDADLKWLEKKRVVVIGYGSQGHGQALNLKDSGIDVHIAVRKDGRGWNLALVGH